MGRGIAHAAALGGYRTILEDLLPGALRKAETEIRAYLDKAVELGKVTSSDADSAMRRVGYAGLGAEAAAESGSGHPSRSRGDGIEDRDLHAARQNLPSCHHPRLEYLIAERHRNCECDLPRAKMCRHALVQSRAQDDTAWDRARARDQGRHA